MRLVLTVLVFGLSVWTHDNASGLTSDFQLCVLIFMLVVSVVESDLIINCVFMHDSHCDCITAYYGALTIVWSYLCLLTLCYWLLVWVGYYSGFWRLVLVVLSIALQSYCKKGGSKDHVWWDKVSRCSNMMKLIIWCVTITLLMWYLLCATSADVVDSIGWYNVLLVTPFWLHYVKQHMYKMYFRRHVA